MSREIKFRAYDSKNKDWVYSDPMPDMGFWKWVAYDNSTVFNEWTGLLDKNGVEIYEGDILAFYSTDQQRVTKYQAVKWESSKLGFNFTQKPTVKVIGNIYEGILPKYENPDIIEQYGIQNDGSPQKSNQRGEQGPQDKRRNQGKDRSSKQEEGNS